jgi:putative toxin-antitoxin system antitoxin component (TIGR02293 family)
MGMAVEVFENEEAARAWMSSPQVGLDGETPLEYANTELGAQEVRNLLGRIDQSVYS